MCGLLIVDCEPSQISQLSNGKKVDGGVFSNLSQNENLRSLKTTFIQNPRGENSPKTGLLVYPVNDDNNSYVFVVMIVPEKKQWMVYGSTECIAKVKKSDFFFHLLSFLPWLL